MSLKGRATGAPAPLLKNAATAPIVYFDSVPVYGATAGTVEIELSTRLLVPEADGSVAAHMACTAHLRCSPQAAAMLIDALTKALDMARKALAQGEPGKA